jgi:hypothetical protein
MHEFTGKYLLLVVTKVQQFTGKYLLLVVTKVQQFLNMFYKFLHRGNISTNKMCVKNFIKCQYYHLLSVGFILANKLTKTLHMSIYISKLREKLVMVKKSQSFHSILAISTKHKYAMKH